MGYILAYVLHQWTCSILGTYLLLTHIALTWYIKIASSCCLSCVYTNWSVYVLDSDNAVGQHVVW